MAAHRYWRLTCTAIPSGGALQFAEIELRNSLGGSDLTGSGTASAQTSAGGHAPSAAVDNDNSTWWQTTTFVPTWWKYDFGSGNSYDVVEIAITPHAGNSTSAPADFLIEYSDDDSTYITAREVRMTWSSDAQRVIPVVVGVEFAPHNMTSNSLPTPYVAAASSEFSGSFAAHGAFNGTYFFTGSYWASSSGAPQWVSLDLGSGNAKSLDSYSIRVNAVPEPNRAPKDFTMQGSNDNSSWTTLDTRTGETSWSSGEIRDYTLSSTSAAYRYFRLNITANNGDSLIEVAELYLRLPTTVILTTSPSDTLASFLDSATINAGTPTQYGLVKSDALGLQDSISYQGPYSLFIGEAITSLDDAQQLILVLHKTFNDSVNNFLDALAKIIGIPIKAFDSQQFNWGDVLNRVFSSVLEVIEADSINNFSDSTTTQLKNIPIRITVSDMLTSMSDAIRIFNTLRILTEDNYVISDALRLRFALLLKVAQVLSPLSDNATLLRTQKPLFADTIANLSDGVSLALSVNLNVLKADILGLTDSVKYHLSGTYNSPSFADRIRRYLNDLTSH